ncbi:hypothetical protein acdb102_05580 [Acidothermaceae bacterium B102]|nr:hypothetical protein acdb102_05580 [Acidothermaceae bacterium B102]
MTSELEQRYGRKRGFTDTQKYAAIVVALVLGTLASYLVFRNSEQAIQSANGNFQVTSATSVIVSFEVDKPAAWTVTCAVRARNAAGAEVGRSPVTIPPGKKVNHETYTLTTTDHAVTGEVEDCVKA